MDTDEYVAELERLRRRLGPNVERVDVKEDGLASFVFARGNGRAVEASRNGCEWWLEFWDEADDEDAPPVGEATASSVDAVASGILKWLERSSAAARLPERAAGS